MVEAGYSAVYSVPMLVVYPAVAIAIAMMAFTFIGDGLRDALDPRTARRMPGRAQTAPVRGQASGLPGRPPADPVRLGQRADRSPAS